MLTGKIEDYCYATFMASDFNISENIILASHSSIGSGNMMRTDTVSPSVISASFARSRVKARPPLCNWSIGARPSGVGSVMAAAICSQRVNVRFAASILS